MIIETECALEVSKTPDVDMDYCLKMIRNDKFGLLPKKCKSNKELIMIAVNHSSTNLFYASEDLKADREVVLVAVKQSGRAVTNRILYYASQELRDDKEVVLAAVSNYGPALCYASEDLKNDREVVLAAVKEDCGALSYAPEKFKSDPEIMQIMLHQIESKQEGDKVIVEPYHWWKEEDFVFEGTPCTKYIWPRDRLIHFQECKLNKDGAHNTILVPTFHIDTVEGAIQDQMRASIKSYYENNYVPCSTTRDELDSVQVFPEKAHLHLIEVRGMWEYGIVVSAEKMDPVTDCWADSEARKNRIFKRQAEYKEKMKEKK